MKPINILGIAGSLRTKSFNRMALAAACGLAPDGMSIRPFEGLGDIPLYNEDVKVLGFPSAATELRRAIAEADALLIVSPEYNFSVPGVLKNAIDWASRPPQMPLAGKPAAIMGASSGVMGTVRAQMHLRQILNGFNMPVMNRPEVLIREAGAKFDAQGRLVDEDTRNHIRTLLERLQDWTLLFKERGA
ncbi:MAG TPA: NADPH-dependent FMN reductase [Alphaproteobacteria bacterium]|nr:NADPH-dependent FMN reductase [Alphaproteobacteria bacterium]